MELNDMSYTIYFVILIFSYYHPAFTILSKTSECLISK